MSVKFYVKIKYFLEEYRITINQGEVSYKNSHTQFPTCLSARGLIMIIIINVTYEHLHFIFIRDNDLSNLPYLTFKK